MVNDFDCLGKVRSLSSFLIEILGCSKRQWLPKLSWLFHILYFAPVPAQRPYIRCQRMCHGEAHETQWCAVIYGGLANQKYSIMYKQLRY